MATATKRPRKRAPGARGGSSRARPRSTATHASGAWKLVILGDNYRRGLWERKTPTGALELCAGREGGEAFVALAPDEVVTPAVLDQFTALLDVVRFSADPSNSPETGRRRRGKRPPPVPPVDHPLARTAAAMFASALRPIDVATLADVIRVAVGAHGIPANPADVAASMMRWREIARSVLLGLGEKRGEERMGSCVACLVPAGVSCRNTETGETVPTHTSRRPASITQEQVAAEYRCSICTLPITGGSMRGTGDGTGQSFAHDACYWRREAESRARSPGLYPHLDNTVNARWAATETWVRAQMADRYKPALALEQVALTSRMQVLKKVLELLGGKAA